MRDVPPPYRPPEPEPCPDCGYPIDACECRSLFGEPDIPLGPRVVDEEEDEDQLENESEEDEEVDPSE